MKKIIFTLFALTFILNNLSSLYAQCGGSPCTTPQAAFDIASACVLPSPQALSCYQGATINSGVVDQPASWCTTVENNQWFAFTANGPTASFQIEALNCASGGAIQAALLDCNLNFVSDCLGNIAENSTVSLNSNVALIPGEVYLLMIDGSAGANCNYAINGSSAITSGPTNLCIPDVAPSNYTSTANADWYFVPAGAGQFVGPSVGTNIFVEWLIPGNVQICAQNTVCPNIPPFCLDVTIGENAQATYNVNLCQGESVFCGGNTYTSAGSFNSTVPGPAGCDSLITCIVSAIPPISSPMQTVNLCGPAEFHLCNDIYTFSGIYTSICDNWQGCDSTASVNLNILEPIASISDPGVLGCGPDSILFLDGSGSGLAFPPNTWTMQWTGPGIVGPTNQILCWVNLPGEYCLTVTHKTSNGQFSCENTMCVNVTEDIQFPSAPQVTGPTTVCANSTSTYTANLQGSVIPDNLTWTVPSGATVTQNPLNYTAVVNWGNSSGGLVCVTANNECGASPPACINVTVNAGPAVPIITGPATVCANSTVQTYTITNSAPGVNYNWTVPAGATFTGSGNTINVNFSNVANGNVTVCATGTNNCGTSTPGCTNVTVTGPPAAPTMSGPTSVCANGGNANFSVTNVQNGVTYTWTAPPGAVVTGTGASVSIDFTNSSPNGQICVTATNSCGNPSICQPISVTAPPTAILSGTGAFCQGTTPTTNFSIELTGQQPWILTYSINGGAPITLNAPSSPFTFPATVAGTYTLVSVTGGNQCTGTVSGSASLVENPSPTAVLTGGGTICEGSGDDIPLGITLSGESPWTLQWSIDGVAQSPLSINSSPFTLPISESLAGNISLGTVSDNNGCTGTGTGASLVEVNGSPTVSDVVVQCNDINTTFTVSFNISGGEPSTYSVLPNNGSLVNGMFTSNPIPTGSGYSFVVADANFCNTINIADPIVVCDCDTRVGTMGLDLLTNCGPGTIDASYDATNQFLDGNDVQVFVLHSGNSVSIEPPVIGTYNSTDITFDPATMSYGTTYYLSAMVGDDDGSGGVLASDPCLQIAQGTPIIFYEIPTAGISGGGEICEGNSLDLTLTLTGEAPWETTINGQTVSIFSSPFTYNVTPNTTTTYDLTNVMDLYCNTPINDSETVTVNTPPTVGTPITQCDPTGTTFTVSFTINGGDPSCYSVTPLNGTLTGNTFTSNPIPDGNGYSYTITDCNGCTPVLVERPLVDCSCLSTAGNLAAAPLSLCGTESSNPIYDQTGEFLDADDARCFILHAGNPLQPLATNTTPEFSFQIGMNYGQAYFICPVVANDDGNGCVDLSDPCISIGGCTEVRFHEIPTALFGPDESICLGDAATLTFNVTGAGPWVVQYQDDQGNPFSMNLNTSPVNADVSPIVNTVYTLTGVTDAFCVGTVAGATSIEVNESPQVQNIIETCSANSTTFTVSFEVIGGEAGTITVTPATGLFNNGIFTSQPLPSPSQWAFAIDDINGCGPVNISGAENCNCLTNAGMMNTNALGICENETVTVPATVGSFLDPDDVLVYYLHTGNGPSLGNVIGTTTTSPPVFGFDDATMDYGVTYYVSAVAGNNNGSGGVDLMDDCLDVAPGTPVSFNQLPTAAISGTASICQGMSTPVVFTATGTGPFTVTYTINGGAPQTVQVPVSGTFSLDVSPDDDQDFALVSVQDANCDNTATGTATLTVNPNVDAGTVNGNFEFCKGVSVTIDLNTKLDDPTPGGTWRTPGGEIIPNGSFNVAGFAEGTYDFTYSVPGLPPCPNDEAIVQVVIHPNPIADAGEPVNLTCELREVTLGGPATSQGMDYAWTGNVSDPNIANPTVSQPGTYALTVTSPQGCTATDAVVVGEDVVPPSADIFVSDVSCFGENDGFITINNISGGTPPYLCSFNGGPFTEQKQFTNLGPGEQVIKIKDAFGCETTLTFPIQEPIEVTVEIDGSFEGSDPIVNLGDPLTLSIETTPPVGELDSIAWFPADLVDCDTCDQNTLFLTQQTTFTVYVEEGGCSDEDVITVFVRKDHPIYVPNAFSPNGDNTNDLLMIYGGKEVKNIKSFLIFSRWGETVFQYYNFEPNNPLFGWNGKHRDELMNSAVFTWYAEVEFIDGLVKLFEGDVTLVR
jgi:gliding motility-associated-like protein